jgi:lysine N6-hydroxylase
LIRFAIHDNNFVLRREYNEYCQWVAGQLKSTRFGFRCETVKYDPAQRIYAVYLNDLSKGRVVTYYCRNLVLGVGTVPSYPACAEFPPANELMCHSSDYLTKKDELLKKESVTIVGSGQSAAEIFYDLLPFAGQFKKGLYWFTRSKRFFPMDYSKLTLEMSTPDYIDYFYCLDQQTRKKVLNEQAALYKGINGSLVNAIYDQLYIMSLSNPEFPISLHTCCELGKVDTNENCLELQFYHTEIGQWFIHRTESIVLATGYTFRIPDFLDMVKKWIEWTPGGEFSVKRNYSVDVNGSLFVQNAELHTHGFNAPDLGLGPYRNAIILNEILGYERFEMEKGVVFQRFGASPGLTPFPLSQ